jgi:hypothetical protein
MWWLCKNGPLREPKMMMLWSRMCGQLRCALTHLVCALGAWQPSTGHEELASNRRTSCTTTTPEPKHPLTAPLLPVDSEPSPCWLARHCARRARSALELAMPPAEPPRYNFRSSHQHLHPTHPPPATPPRPHCRAYAPAMDVLHLN